MAKQVFLSLSLIFSGLHLVAQSNEGTEFWFGFMEHRDIGENTKVVMITAKKSTSGTVRIPLLNWEQDFSVAANNVSVLSLPVSVENQGSEDINNLGLVVESNDPVSVYIHQYHQWRSEAGIVLPFDALGNEYYILGHQGVSNFNVDYPSQFLLVGTRDGTELSFRLSADSRDGKWAGQEYTIYLDQGETYQVQGRRAADDMTGTYISSNQPVAVFSGARWTEIPTGCEARDNLLEQMYPNGAFGRQFVTVPFAQLSYDVFRVLAREDQTDFSVAGANGTANYSLNAGEFVEFNRNQPGFINSNKPIAVAQYMVGSGCNGYDLGDPAMLVLNSVEQIRDTVTLFNSSFQNIDENYLNIVTRTADVDHLFLDGVLVGASFQPLPGNTDFSYAQLPVANGSHTLISEGCGLIATAYGYGVVESYAYSGGASFRSLDANPIPEGGCLSDTIFFNSGLSPGRFSFLWDLGDGTTSTEPHFEHKYDALGSYQVVLYLHDECLDIRDTLSRELLITLRQSLELPGDTSLCAGDYIQFTATDLPGATYLWKGPNGFLRTQQSFTLSNIDEEDAGAYSVVGTVSGCASYPAFREIEVDPLPKPDLGNDTVFCFRDALVFPVLSPGVFEQYSWNNQNSLTEFSPTVPGEFWVRVWDENGCSDTDSVEILEICPTRVYIPNAFSPNDDGWNDYFQVFGTDVISIHWAVYDRWGGMLFEANSIDDRWDGFVDGEPVPPGVYIWKAEISGYKEGGEPYFERKAGDLTLVR